MGQRQIIGWGGGWSENTFLSDEAVGLFKWLLSVSQSADGTIRAVFVEKDAVGGSVDGDSFKPDIRVELTPAEDSNGVEGQLIAVASSAVSEGANGSTSVKINSEGKFEFQHTFSNDPDHMEWLFQFVATPSDDGCPNIEVFSNNATKSEDNFYWGNSLNKSTVPQNRTSPEVCISPTCNQGLEGFFAGEILPLATPDDVTDGIFDTSTES